MKILKRTLLTLLILLIVTFMFRGWLYRNLVSYASIGMRNNYSITNPDLKFFIDSNSNVNDSTGIEQIVKLGLSLTSEKLRYTDQKNSNDPNAIINTGTAHCVGYANFFAATCNYLLSNSNLAGIWTARPQIGKLHFLGVDIHQYFRSPFFKDHDFVTIENKKTGMFIAVDPTIHDYSGINRVTYEK